MFSKDSGVRRSGSDIPGLRRWDPKPSDEGSASKKKEGAVKPGELQSYDRRPSVRDLANKFEIDAANTFENARAGSPKGKGNAEEWKSKLVKDSGVSDKGGRDASIVSDEDSQFSKLNSSLNDLRMRVQGRSKIDVDEALKASKLLSLIYDRRDAELAHERAETKKMALLAKQSSDDAKRLVEETHSHVLAEMATARDETEKVQAAFDEYRQRSVPGIDLTELERLKKTSKEAERIKLLHESSNTKAMENQIKSLRQQLSERSAEIGRLQELLEAFYQQGPKNGKLQWYELTGPEQLGATLSITPLDEKVSDVSLCQVQWHRVAADGSADHVISGAVRPQYAPEPFDIGKFLRAEVTLPSGKLESLQTEGPIGPAVGLDSFVDILFNKGSAQFCVRIVLKNGEILGKQSVHTLYVNKTRMKLKRNQYGVAKEIYSPAMQLCGARGGGDSSAQGLFWAPKKGMVFMMVLESERERNAAILLTRKFAKLNKVNLRGPDDVTPVE